MEKSKEFLKIYHKTTGYKGGARSTRPIYMYKELELLYKGKLPKLEVHVFDNF